jgi:site-specific recombinase XerD
MSGKTAIGFDAKRSLAQTPAVGEIVTVLAPGTGTLPRRRAHKGPTTIERFVAALGPLLDKDVTIAELNFTKALEARSPATLRAMTSDLASYAAFAGDLRGPALPASAEQLTRWIDHLEAQRQKPSTIARKLATLASVHALAGLPCQCSSQLVRDAMRGLRRRNGTAQRQAAGLRLGDEISDVAITGFTVASLLEVCGADLPGLRDAALISLGYDAGLRVSELVAVTVEALVVQDNGSGVLEIGRSKTDQEGQGAFVWLSPETMRRVAAWREAAAIRSGALFPRIGVTRQKARAARRALAISDIAYNARLDLERMTAQPPRLAATTYTVGNEALTPSAVRAILMKRALVAADQGLVSLFGDDLQRALGAISTHSLRVGLTQDLFANGEDAGPIAQALRWSSIGTALRYGRRLSPGANAAARMLAERRK